MSIPEYEEPGLAGNDAKPEETAKKNGWILRMITPHDLSLDNTNLGSLSKKYGVDPKEIVARNGAKWGVEGINQMVIKAGGKWLPKGKDAKPVKGSPTGGWAVLKPGAKLKLPRVAEIPDPSGRDGIEASAPGGGGGLGSLLMWGGLIAGGWWLFNKMDDEE